MKSSMVYLRYWGSHFKSLRHVEAFSAELGAMVCRGWRCILVLERMPAEAAWLDRLDAAGIKLLVIRRPRKTFDWAVVRQVRDACARYGVSVMACDNMHTSPLLGASWAGVPVRLWFVRNMSTHYEQVRSPTLRERIAPSMRLSCLLATRVLAISGTVKEELVALGIPSRKVKVMLNPRRLGTDTGLMSRSEAREHWGFKESDVVVGTVGRGIPVKGWDILVEAFAGVSRVDSDARLLLVGSFTNDVDRHFVDGLQQQIKDYHLEGRVVFAGYLEDMPTAFRAMDIFCLPSRSEGFSYALIEAIEAGLPGVAARVGVASEMIVEGVSGYLVNRCEPEELSRALLRLTGDFECREHCRQNSKLPASIMSPEEYGIRFAMDCEEIVDATLMKRRQSGVISPSR